MTQYVLTSAEYVALRRRLTRQLGRAAMMEILAAAVIALTGKAFPLMSKMEMSVLLSLLAMTLGSGRLARELTISELINGIEQENGTREMGAGMSRTQAFEGLSRLKARGFVNSYSFQLRQGVANTAQILEIALNKISMPLAARAKLLWKSEENPHQNSRIPPSGNPHQSSLYIQEGTTFLSELNMHDFQSCTQRSGDTLRKTLVGAEPQGENELHSSSKSAADVLASIQQRHAAKRTARVSSATGRPAASLSKDELQAVIDAAAKAVGLPIRVYVTEKSLGVFRKRAAERPVANLQAMVEFSLGQWSRIAMQNAAALRKAGSTRPPIASSPTFMDFAFRYPYFLTAYENNRADQSAPQAEKDEEKDALRRKLQQAQQTINTLQRRVVARPRPVQEAPVAPTLVRRVPRTRPVTDEELFAEVDIPEWKDAEK